MNSRIKERERVLHQRFKDSGSNPDSLRDLGFLSGPLGFPSSSAWMIRKRYAVLARSWQGKEQVTNAEDQTGQ